MNDITKKIISAIKKVKEFDDSKNIDEKDRLSEDLSFSSMNFIKLIVELENIFDIEIDDSNATLSNYKKIIDLEKLVKKFL